MFASLQSLIVQVLALAALGGAVWGLIEAARFAPNAYVAAGKNSKVLWVSLLGGATVLSFLSLPSPLGRGSGPISILGIAAVIVIVYFFVEIRPKVSQFHRPGGGSAGGGSSGGGW